MAHCEVIARCEGPGMAAVTAPPEEALRESVRSLLGERRTPSLALCGMAGARGGLREAGYRETPVTIAEWAREPLRFTLDGMAVAIAAGVAARSPDREEVMRGEETQVFGAMRLDQALMQGPNLFVLPGTHCKWVRCDDGRIVDFVTGFTGELFALLRGSTLLAAGEDDSAMVDEEGFAAGVAQGRREPAVLTALFQARSRQLRAGKSPAWARAWLSGLLIARETSEVEARFTLPRSVVVIGESALSQRYAQVLGQNDIAARHVDAEAATLAGLRVIDVEA